jgi:hypothetical protein
MLTALKTFIQKYFDFKLAVNNNSKKIKPAEKAEKFFSTRSVMVVTLIPNL